MVLSYSLHKLDHVHRFLKLLNTFLHGEISLLVSWATKCRSPWGRCASAQDRVPWVTAQQRPNAERENVEWRIYYFLMSWDYFWFLILNNHKFWNLLFLFISFNSFLLQFWWSLLFLIDIISFLFFSLNIIILFTNLSNFWSLLIARNSTPCGFSATGNIFILFFIFIKDFVLIFILHHYTTATEDRVQAWEESRETIVEELTNAAAASAQRPT